MNRKFSEQELIRRKKLETLRNNKINPFGSSFEQTITSQEIKSQFENKSREELEKLLITSQPFKIAGRIMTKRGKGKAGFANLKDYFGQIQLYIKSDQIDESEFINIWEPLDLGDIIGVEGFAMKTKVGELSIKVTKLTLLTKALKPLPDKHKGLQDLEIRARKRYLDLLVNQKSKETAIARTKIIRAIQHYLDNNGFIEVETPILHSTLGGAAAKPFKTHHNTLDMEFNLRIATELPLKKLVVGGLDKVYEIGRLFRNEGVSKIHNPEFTAIEIYQAYSDYKAMMDLTENIFKTINCQVYKNKNIFEYEGVKIDISKPFKRINMLDAIKENTGVDFWKKITLEEAKEIAKEHKVHVPKHFTGVGHIINAFFEEFVEEKIVEPTFIIGHPVEISPLAKLNPEDSRFTERFELFILGREYANAFSELNDPIDQIERFEKQVEEKNLGNDEATDIDMEYIEAIEYGLPPTGGLGIGIDRTIMFFTGSSTIREVILFPHNRNKEGN